MAGRFVVAVFGRIEREHLSSSSTASMRPVRSVIVTTAEHAAHYLHDEPAHRRRQVFVQPQPTYTLPCALPFV